jgi:hypothetical protein
MSLGEIMSIKILFVLLLTAGSLYGFPAIALAEDLPVCENYQGIQPSSIGDSPTKICESSEFVVQFPNGIVLGIPEKGTINQYTDLGLNGDEVQVSVSLSETMFLTTSEQTFNAVSSPARQLNAGTMLLTDGGGPVQADIGCQFSSFSLTGAKLAGTYSWYYDYRNQSSTEALHRIQGAMDFWQYPLNRCTGETFSTQLKTQFLGSTTNYSSRITSTGCNGPFDGINLVSWLPLDIRTLAVTCRNFNSTGTRITEADIAFNTLYAGEFFDLSDPSLCGVGDYFLINVAAHEFGHAIGLAHVPDSNQQIMSGTRFECLHEKVGLATGDYLGLLRLYGVGAPGPTI